ncbi:MAG: DUF4258 domain-containing protein [Actinobacteria bacterium]|nr:DUF4258 domain-containing protein [Actinomycetota bacterium]
MEPMSARLVFSQHALGRLLDWHLDVADIEAALVDGETIEEYEDGAKLILGRSGLRPLHVVIRDETLVRFVITVYEPSAGSWDAGFRHRLEDS